MANSPSHDLFRPLLHFSAMVRQATAVDEPTFLKSLHH